MSETLLYAAGYALAGSIVMTAALAVYDHFAPASHVQQRHDLALAALITGPLVFLIALLPQSIDILPRQVETIASGATTIAMNAIPASEATLLPDSATGLPIALPAVVLTVWAAASLVLLLRLGRDLFSLRTLLRRSAPARLSTSPNLSRPVETRQSGDVLEPMLAGYLRPVVYLPHGFDVTAPSSQTVLEHEIAHLNRRDTWILLAERIIGAVFWWLVPVFLLQPVLSKSRESLCDRYAAEQTGDPLVMAHALLDAAERRTSGPALALAIAGRRSSLSQRIHYLADLKPSSNKAVIMKLPLILPALAAVALITTPRVGAAVEIDPAGLNKLAGMPGNLTGHGEALRLIEAVQRGDMRHLDRLLEQGMDPNTIARGDGTALIAAIRMRRNGMVERLLEAGADPDTVSPGDGSALIEAARQGDTAMLTLLLEAGANPNVFASGDGTALIQAAAGNHVSAAEKLLRAGADVNGYAPADETPMINAARSGHVEMAELLLEAGADLSLTVEAGSIRDDARYRSPISEAQRFNQRGMIRWLEERGAEHRPPTR